MLKCAVVGGTSIVFTRYNGVGVTKIRSHQIENLKLDLELFDQLPKPSKIRRRVKEKLDECPEISKTHAEKKVWGVIAIRTTSVVKRLLWWYFQAVVADEVVHHFQPPRKYSSLKGSPLSCYALNLIFQETWVLFIRFIQNNVRNTKQYYLSKSVSSLGLSRSIINLPPTLFAAAPWLSCILKLLG